MSVSEVQDATESHPPVRVILVGLGGMGTGWANWILPPARDRGLIEPVAAVDVDPGRFAVAREGLGLGESDCFTSTADALAAREADAVVVVTPPGFHEEVVRAAAEAGVHVLCEKPLADTLEAAVRMSRAVDAAGVKMAVTMSHRFDQDKQSLQSLVRGGELGELGYVVIRFTSASRHFGDWGAEFRHTMADPLLVEGAVHQLDILRAISGSDAKTVYAQSWNPRWGEYGGDSTALVTIEMENGVHCLYEGAKANASSLNTWGMDYIRAECESGTAILDRRRLSVVTSGREGLLTVQERPLVLSRDTWTHGALVEDFCAWVNGGPAPETTHHDNLQACALLYAAVRSAHSGQPVDVQAFLAEAIAAVDEAEA